MGSSTSMLRRTLLPLIPAFLIACTSAPEAPPAAGQARVTVTPPAAPEGLLAGGGPYMVPIQIAGASDIATISLTLTYDASVLRSPTVTQGSFMDQGNASSTFVPAVDAEAGRIDLAMHRQYLPPQPHKRIVRRFGFLIACSLG